MDSVLNLTTPPLVILYGISTGGGTRAGFFRTPISGGVRNATSAHGLPRLALAVRNLMEQVAQWLVRFAIFLAVITKNIAMYFVCGFDKDENSLDSWVEWLVNARVTIFGNVYPLPKDQQELNALFSKPLKVVLSKEAELDYAALISIDKRGVGYSCAPRRSGYL